MHKYEVEFSYVNYDVNDDIHNGGPISFTIEADCKECAFDEAYHTALETGGVDEITDMTITCKDTGEKYDFTDIEQYFDKQEEERAKDLKERKIKCSEKYRNSDRVEALKKLYNSTIQSFINDGEKNIEELTIDSLVNNFCVYIDDEELISLYDKAPSDTCKLYLALSYCESSSQLENIDYDEPTKFETEVEIIKQYLEKKLSIRDFKYLRDEVSHYSVIKSYYSDIIKKLEDKGKVEWDKVERVGTEIFLI